MGVHVVHVAFAPKPRFVWQCKLTMNAVFKCLDQAAGALLELQRWGGNAPPTSGVRGVRPRLGLGTSKQHPL